MRNSEGGRRVRFVICRTCSTSSSFSGGYTKLVSRKSEDLRVKRGAERIPNTLIDDGTSVVSL